MSVPERRAMVERPSENLSVLNLARSGVYRPVPVTSADDRGSWRLAGPGYRPASRLAAGLADLGFEQPLLICRPTFTALMLARSASISL